MLFGIDLIIHMLNIKTNKLRETHNINPVIIAINKFQTK